jgi:hypothetical protein
MTFFFESTFQVNKVIDQNDPGPRDTAHSKTAGPLNGADRNWTDQKPRTGTVRVPVGSLPGRSPLSLSEAASASLGRVLFWFNL